MSRTPRKRAARQKPMAKRQHTRSAPVEDLRRAIDCLPVSTRRAMLEGVRSERIIAGAYVDGRGGVCPMLAAHRRGARTNFLSFARAWDRFARAGRQARSATTRELKILAGQLQSSLLNESQLDLDRAIAEHRELVRRRALAQADPTGPIRARRLRVSSPWRRARGLRSVVATFGAGSGTPPRTAGAEARRVPEAAAHS
jgi:hypothetical protein